MTLPSIYMVFSYFKIALILESLCKISCSNRVIHSELYPKKCYNFAGEKHVKLKFEYKVLCSDIHISYLHHFLSYAQLVAQCMALVEERVFVPLLMIRTLTICSYELISGCHWQIFSAFWDINVTVNK